MTSPLLSSSLLIEFPSPCPLKRIMLWSGTQYLAVALLYIYSCVRLAKSHNFSRLALNLSRRGWQVQDRRGDLRLHKCINALQSVGLGYVEETLLALLSCPKLACEFSVKNYFMSLPSEMGLMTVCLLRGTHCFGRG